MSNETSSLSLPSAVGISLASLPVGTAPGDVFQWNGTQWTIVPNDNNNPLLLPGVAPPVAPGANSGVLYKQTGSDGLWWRTDLVAPIDVTLAAAATTDVPQGLNVFIANPNIPAAGNNYATIQAAINAAEVYAIANPTLEQPVVLVAPGVYNEALVVSRNIILMGQGAAPLYNSRSVVVDSLALGPCLTLNAPCLIKNIAFDRTGDAGSRVVLGAGWNIAVGDTSLFVDCAIFGAAVNVAHTIDWSDATIANRSLTLKNTTVQATLNTSNAILIGGTNFVYLLDGTFGRHSGVIQITSTFAFPLLMDKMDWNGRVHLNNGGGGASTLALLNSTLASNAAVPCIYDSSNFGTVQLQSTTVAAGAATAPINLTFGTNLSHDSLRVSTTLGREPNVTPGTTTQNDPATVARDLNVFTVNPNLPNFNRNYHTIQAAINASTNVSGTPDVILLAPGTYTENLTVDKHVSIVGQPSGIDDSGVDDGRKPCIISGTTTIASRCSFVEVGLQSNTPLLTSALVSSGALGATNVQLRRCRLAGDPLGVSYVIDWTLGSGTLRLDETYLPGNADALLLLTLAGAKNVFVHNSKNFTGQITHAGTGALIMVDVLTRYGNINMTAIGAQSYLTRCTLSSQLAASLVTSAVASTLQLTNCILSTANAVGAVNLSDVGSTLVSSNNTIRNQGANSSKLVCAGTVTQRSEPTVPADLNVFLVNPNVAQGYRNFHTIQAAIDAAVATLPEAVNPIVHVTSGSYTEPVLTISGNITLRGDSRESVVFTGTTISCNSTCRIEDLTCNGVAASALTINVAIPLSQLIAAKNCTFINTGGVAPTVDWGVGSASCSFRPTDCSFSSGSTAWDVLRLAYTNTMLATDCSWIGRIENSNPNNNTLQLVGGTLTGPINLVNPYLPASGATPVVLGTRLHIIDYRCYSDNDTPAISSTMDFARVLSDNCDYLVNGVVATDAIALTGPSNQLVECGTTFSTHPNRVPTNVTRITVSDNNIIHEDSPVVGPQLNIYTVNPNVPQSYRNFHTIQAAVTAAEAALPTTGLDKATIHITKGNYQEDVTIAKRVELIGIGAGARGYYQSGEIGDVELQGTVYANSPCVLENIVFNPGLAAVPLNASIFVGLWLTDSPIPPYNEADSVVCNNCMFVSNGNPGYCVANTTNQTARNAGKRANIKLFDCLQDNAGLFANLSNGNVLYMTRSTSVGAILLNPVQGATGNTAVLVGVDSTLLQLGAAGPTISIAGVAQAAPALNISLLRCVVQNGSALQVPIDSALNNVIVSARSTEFNTANANAIRLTGLATEIRHNGLWSANVGAPPTLSAVTVSALNAIV